MTDILVTSDLHLKPGDSIPQFLKDMFQTCTMFDLTCILNGDVIDLLPYGKGKWKTPEGKETLRQLKKAMPKKVYFIFGNHEGNIAWLKEIFREDPHIKVVKELRIANWQFEHGHRFAFDWKWLQWIADDITQWMVHIAPGLWTRFCKYYGWMPSKIKEDKPHKYTKAVGRIWSNALRYAQKENVSLVIGHTHTRSHIALGTGITIVDIGHGEVVRI